MANRSIKSLLKNTLCILLGIGCSLVLANPLCNNIPTVIQKPIIFDAKRIALTQAYRRTHYDIQTESIEIVPKMIVLHWTALSTFKKSFDYLNPPTLGNDRSEIGTAGELNVSAHFIVDRDGTIYQIMPTNYMARHVIGLNNIAIGIENIGGVGNKEDLTEKQIEANAALICLLKQRYPSIEYLIGHFEYAQFRQTSLWQERDKSYYTKKADPGRLFMREVRKRVSGLGLLQLQRHH